MAAPQARSWANLPTDCLNETFDRVPCAADRHRAYLACTTWLKAAAVDCPPPTVGAPKLPPALPWLLLPAPAPDRHGSVVCVLSGYRVHPPQPILTITPGLRLRCFGSHDGAWLFVHRRKRNHYSYSLINLRTGDGHGIPGKVRMSPTDYSVDMVIHATALSSSPDDASCVAVSIVTPVQVHPLPLPRHVAIWRKGWPRAVEIRPPDLETGLAAEDVAYHGGAFYLLHDLEDHISVCTARLLEGNRLGLKWGTRRFHPGAGRGRIYDYGSSVRSRYLVWSRGELLLVVRFAFTPNPNEPTSKFKVFKETERPKKPDADSAFPVAEYPWAWSELDSLDGRILFVGYGCSRSYELYDAQGRIQYKGFEAGIFFLDDGDFYDVVVIAGIGPKQYPCRDNGRWSDDGRVQLCFPPADPSSTSPPAWLLP